ncbi:MAG: ComEA family DNA-binding protein [Arenicella sp.]
MKLSIFSTRNLLSIACAGFLWFSSTLALALPVNINNADAEMIADALNGIGQKTAEKIIDYRKANGPFKSADDLLNIQGIGEKKLAKIREDVKLK